MASGGIYDQIGGGFARYSVDAAWIVPHFEKMLYDNALLARAYLHAWQVTAEPLFRRVCVETLDWAMRELRQDEGGFASSLDADSEGVEGKFYVWTPAEIRAVLPAPLADIALRHYGVTEEGNFEGASIPVRATPDPDELPEIKSALLAARAARVRPGLDDKRLTSWNALMISALADAGAALERADYVAAAVACARVHRARAARGRRHAAAHLQPRAGEAAGVPRGPRVPARGVPHACTRRRSTSAGSSAARRARRRDPGPLLRLRARRLLLHRGRRTRT